VSDAEGGPAEDTPCLYVLSLEANDIVGEFMQRDGMRDRHLWPKSFKPQRRVRCQIFSAAANRAS